MSEREEVCGHCGCTGGAIVQKGDLPKKYHATYADCCDALRSQLAEVERERENVSSQLWDCTNERDGYKHRAERAEHILAALREPSEAVIEAMRGHIYADGSTSNDVVNGIRAVVAAAEQESQP